MSKIKADDLVTAVNEALSAYGQGVTEDLKADVKQVAQECAQEIRANARALFNGNAYASDWKATKTDENASGVAYKVHSPKHYYLAHLLEHGHAKRGGGRVEGRPHIGPAEDNATTKLEQKVKERVKQ